MVQEKYEVRYQWFKDDTELQRQNSCSLVLDSVKMCDFGCYSCQVTRIGGESQPVTSDPADLEVVPCDEMSKYFWYCVVARAVNPPINHFLSNKRPIPVLWRNKRCYKQTRATTKLFKGVILLAH